MTEYLKGQLELPHVPAAAQKPKVPRPVRAKPVPPAMPQAADSDPAAIETPPALTAVEQAFKDWSEAIFEIWWRDYYVDGTTGLDDDYLGSALIEAFVCGESA